MLTPTGNLEHCSKNIHGVLWLDCWDLLQPLRSLQGSRICVDQWSKWLEICRMQRWWWPRWLAGTTWHTAGLFWSLRPNDTEIELLTHTRKVITGLQEVSGQNIPWILYQSYPAFPGNWSWPWLDQQWRVVHCKQQGEDGGVQEAVHHGQSPRHWVPPSQPWGDQGSYQSSQHKAVIFWKH